MSSREQQGKKKDYDHFDIYINKIFKSIHPSKGINGEAMNELNQFIKVLVEMMSRATNELLLNNGRKTIDERDIKSATELVLYGELIRHANDGGNRALTNYDKALYNKEKGKDAPKYKTEMAGLMLSVPRIEKLMMKYSIAERKSTKASIYMTAVVEYVIAELLELSGKALNDTNLNRVKPRQVKLALLNDSELIEVFKNTITPGGVIPNIHISLLPRRFDE